MKITGKEFADFIRKSEQNRIVRGILKLDTPDMADIICVIVGEDKPVVVWNAPAGKNESEGKTESGTFAKMETVPAVMWYGRNMAEIFMKDSQCSKIRLRQRKQEENRSGKTVYEDRRGCCLPG